MQSSMRKAAQDLWTRLSRAMPRAKRMSRERAVPSGSHAPVPVRQPATKSEMRLLDDQHEPGSTIEMQRFVFHRPAQRAFGRSARTQPR